MHGEAARARALGLTLARASSTPRPPPRPRPRPTRRRPPRSPSRGPPACASQAKVAIIYPDGGPPSTESYREYLKKTPIPTHVYTCMYYVPASRKRPARSRTSTTAPCSTRPPGAHPLHGHEVPRDPCGLRRLVLEKNAEARASVANPDCSAPLCTVTISKWWRNPLIKRTNLKRGAPYARATRAGAPAQLVWRLHPESTQGTRGQERLGPGAGAPAEPLGRQVRPQRT